MEKIVAFLAVVAFAVAACAGPQVLITSEQILTATGVQFVETNVAFNTLCAVNANPRMDVKTCDAWKGFVPEYQATYKQAELLWNDLAACELAEAKTPTGRDCGDKAEIVGTILRVKNTLMNFAFKLLAVTSVKGGV